MDRSISPLLVISWWSNCLALDCLDHLVVHTTHRPVYVLQVGKSPEQKARFRASLPGRVVELEYPENLPAEHSRVIQYAAFHLLGEESGLWLVDHDVFYQAGLDDWLEAADHTHKEVETLLCLPRREKGNPANTSPMFWLAPRGWPAELYCIDPVPFHARDESRRPDLFRSRLELVMPQKDTLMQAKEALEARGRVCFYPVGNQSARAGSTPEKDMHLAGLPEHSHLGGLSLFTNQIPTELYRQVDWFRQWMRQTVEKFVQFYAACPPARLALEDPILIQRVGEYQEFVYG